MKAYAINQSGSINPKAYTSLKKACQVAGISYSQATRGKRLFSAPDGYIIILELEIVRIKGRENNASKARSSKGKSTQTHYEPLDE